MSRRITIGVISDTHGLMRPEALHALHGVDHILHAGDVGGPEVLSALATIAPVTAVRGNNDVGAWAKGLPDSATVTFGKFAMHVLHEIALFSADSRQKYAAVITGHSHRPLCETREGVLYLNPGSAGPRRFTLPIAVARLEVGTRLTAKIVTLDVSGAPRR